jgi:hypothetical protein
VTNDHDDAPRPAPASGRGGRVELRRILERVRGRVRLTRGLGAHEIIAMMARVNRDDPLDDRDEQRLAHLIESLIFAVEDAEAAARRPHPRW